jgi:hypothetical protein
MVKSNGKDSIFCYAEKQIMKQTIYDRGNVSESIVMAAYLKAGFMVSIPFGAGAPYDLIVDTGNRLCRVQVKTGWLRKGCILYKGKRRVREAHPMLRGPIWNRK